MESDIKKNERIAGVDFGSKRIGIAIADTSLGIASPHSTCHRKSDELDAKFFTDLIASNGIERFVVGLPVHLDGQESQKSKEAREFGQWLNQLSSVPVDYFDERFTTVEADEMLASTNLTKKKRGLRRDQLAAQIMLSAYLESEGPAQPWLESID